MEFLGKSSDTVTLSQAHAHLSLADLIKKQAWNIYYQNQSNDLSTGTLENC